MTDHCRQIQFQSAFVPLNLSWQAQNTAGETKKQCTTALMFIGSCFGNVRPLKT